MLKSFGLTGKSENRVDAKGRVSIPSQMRRILAPDDHDEVAISLGREGHLSLFNKDYWVNTIQQNVMNIVDSAAGMKDWAALQREIHRISENSHMSSVDNQGRIIIPHWLLEKAVICDTVLIIGAVDRVNLWCPDRYAAWLGDYDAGSSLTGIYI